MTHLPVTWVLNCTIWCYHYTHLHTSCLTEIMFCALRWGHCPSVGFFLCPGLLRKGSLIQTGAQQLPAHRSVATLSMFLCALIAATIIVMDIMLGALCGGQSPAFSSQFSPSTTGSWDWTLSLWLDLQWLLLLSCLSATAIPIFITCFMSQTGSPFPCCSGVSVVSRHCPKRIKTGLEILFCPKTTTHCRVTFICKET